MREHVGGEEEEKGETRSRKKDIHVVLDACQDMPFSLSLIYMVFVLFFPHLKQTGSELTHEVRLFIHQEGHLKMIGPL